MALAGEAGVAYEPEPPLTREEMKLAATTLLTKALAPCPQAAVKRAALHLAKTLESELRKENAVRQAVMKRLLATGSALELFRTLHADVARANAVNAELRPAVAALRRALVTGQVHASGVTPCIGDPRRRPVDPSEWLIGIEPWLDGTARQTGEPVPVTRDLLFDTHEVLCNWPADADAVSSGGPPGRAHSGGVARNPGGAPATHPWGKFWDEVHRWRNKKNLNHSRRELQRYMQCWTAQHWDPVPEDATIRKKIAGFYKEVEGL